jgi:transposase-like protein
MNPQEQFCPNNNCADRGKIGYGNIVSHSQKEQRCKCQTCGRTFAIRRGTALHGLKKEADQFVLVVSLLAYGCPVQAIVRALGLDERTVRGWWRKAGQQSERIHEHMIGKSQLDLQQVQADEIKVKTQRGTLWMAMAMMVATRLWLGGVISPQRDTTLIQTLIGKVRAMALCRELLLAVDGLSSYVKAFRLAFRSPLPHRGRGRPRLIAWTGIHIVQVVKQRTGEVWTIQRRIVQGSQATILRLIHISQGSGGINTAYIERLNATFRQRLAGLARRSRQLIQQQASLQAGMFLVGTVYNFCTDHHSLRIRLWLTERQYHWVPRTPAMAAHLTDHRWTVMELMSFKIPPSPFVPPKRRGRPPKVPFSEVL